MSSLRITVAIAGACVGMSLVAADAEAFEPATSTLDCDSAVEFPEPIAPPATEAVTFGRVAIQRRFRGDLAPYSGRGPFRYWAKSGLRVHRHGTPLGPEPGPLVPVELIVPTEWRNRAAIGWGNTGVSSTVRIIACRSTTAWLAFSGGFYVRSPACFPLIVRVGARSKRIRIAVGRPC